MFHETKNILINTECNKLLANKSCCFKNARNWHKKYADQIAACRLLYHKVQTMHIDVSQHDQQSRNLCIPHSIRHQWWTASDVSKRHLTNTQRAYSSIVAHAQSEVRPGCSNVISCWHGACEEEWLQRHVFLWTRDTKIALYDWEKRWQ